MSQRCSGSGLRHTLAAALAVSVAGAAVGPAHAAPSTLVGDHTRLERGLGAATLSASGISTTWLGTASLSPDGVVILPITGGSVDVATLSGTIDHAGGGIAISRAGFGQIQLMNLTIDLDATAVIADVTVLDANGAPIESSTDVTVLDVTLCVFSGGVAPCRRPRGSIRLGGFGLSATPSLESTIATRLGVPGIDLDSQSILIAEVKARTASPAALASPAEPEPQGLLLSGVGLGAMSVLLAAAGRRSGVRRFRGATVAARILGSTGVANCLAVVAALVCGVRSAGATPVVAGSMVLEPGSIGASLQATGSATTLPSGRVVLPATGGNVDLAFLEGEVQFDGSGFDAPGVGGADDPLLDLTNLRIYPNGGHDIPRVPVFNVAICLTTPCTTADGALRFDGSFGFRPVSGPFAGQDVAIAGVELQVGALLPAEPACADWTDNDGDESVDTADGGCSGAADPSEEYACGDGLDNDGDGLFDYPADPGCASLQSSIENPECNDGINNDAGEDGLIDLADPQCSGIAANPREGATCGLLGVEAIPLLALARVLRSLRRARGAS